MSRAQANLNEKTMRTTNLILSWLSAVVFFAIGVTSQLIEPRAVVWAADEIVPLPLRGEIKHRAVSDALPKDREEFGIGEEIEFWVDQIDDPNAMVSWQVLGGGTVYPVLGIATTVKVDLSAGDGPLSIEPARRDPGKLRTADMRPEQQLTPKWLQEQIDALPKFALKPVGQIPPAEIELSEGLQNDLYHKLDAVRAGPRAEVGRVDELGQTMLTKYSDPKERGQIYFQLAHVHAQCGLQDPQRVIEYATKALEHPLDDRQIPRLYLYRGDAVQLAKLTASFGERRRAAAIPYLAGLKTVMRFKLPEEVPQQPIGRLFGGFNPDDEAAQREHQRMLAAHKLEKFQTEMIQHRKVLTGQLRALYRQEPRDFAELQFLANRVLENSSSVEWLIESVQEDEAAKGKP